MFLNVFAANDRESIVMLWKLLGLDRPAGHQVGVLINNRGDRMRRAQDMADIIAKEMHADWYMAAGDQAAAFIDMCVRLKIPRQKLVNMGGKGVGPVLDRMFELTQGECTVMGIGNIGGFGMPLTELLDAERLRQQEAARGEQLDLMRKADPSPNDRGPIRGERA